MNEPWLEKPPRRMRHVGRGVLLALLLLALLAACGEVPLPGEEARAYPLPSAVARTSRPTESPGPPLPPAASRHPTETRGPLPSRDFGDRGRYLFPRPAGVGTIIEYEALQCAGCSRWVIINGWIGVIEDREIEVIAGAQQQGDDTRTLPPPWPSLLLVEVRRTTNSAYIRAESGTYYLPVADGPARIVDAVGTRLTVATQGGMGFYFDVATRQFTRLDGPVRRPAGDGTIVESGAAPFSIPPEYTFTNQWYAERGGERVTVLAGAIGPETGLWNGQAEAILFVAVTPVGQPVEFADGTVYLLSSVTNPEGGWHFSSARIVGVEGDRLMLADTGWALLQVIFDLATRRVVKPADFPEPRPPQPTAAPRTPTPPTPTPVPYP